MTLVANSPAIFTLSQLTGKLSCLTSPNNVLPDVQIQDVVTDSRKITRGCLFVALRGDNFDAHHFLAEVALQGAAAVVVEALPDNYPLPAIIVTNTRQALGEIAHFWRSQFSLPVIGVTGSNGKTTVKEMIASIMLSAFGKDNYLATQGNLNNDVGVPLTLFKLRAQHVAADIELGMNHPGEIAQLAAIAAPTVGLVNNAQREHQEFMQSVDAVAAENGAVLLNLPANGVAVFPANDTYSDLWRSYAGNKKVLTFDVQPINSAKSFDAKRQQADISATVKELDFGSVINVSVNSNVPKTCSINLSAAGLHNVHNALAAFTCCYAIGVEIEAIVKGLENFNPVNGRLQKKQANNGACVIDDTYNANPDSVRAAIDVLALVKNSTILVLGDMGEVGADGPLYHTEIGRYAAQQGIKTLYTLGQLAKKASEAFGQGAQHFDDVEYLNAELKKYVKPDTTVLIKGSRFMKMERVVMHLVQSNN